MCVFVCVGGGGEARGGNEENRKSRCSFFFIFPLLSLLSHLSSSPLLAPRLVHLCAGRRARASPKDAPPQAGGPRPSTSARAAREEQQGLPAEQAESSRIGIDGEH